MTHAAETPGQWLAGAAGQRGQGHQDAGSNLIIGSILPGALPL